jgi:hypothetical protein
MSHHNKTRDNSLSLPHIERFLTNLLDQLGNIQIFAAVPFNVLMIIDLNQELPIIKLIRDHRKPNITRLRTLKYGTETN